MKLKVTWQKWFDVDSEIEYLGEEIPGQHYFFIKRNINDNPFDPEEDECVVLVEDHKVVGYDGYGDVPSDIEMEAIEKILMEKNII